MAPAIRWGILGTGNIARQFARGLQSVPDANLVAVGSRSAETAAAFADMFAVTTRHASYEALAQDPEVDAVYIGTPHHLHHENALLCIEAGKAVLCEKPFAINAQQAEEVVQAARDKGVFIMEAMWTRFFPAITRMRALVAEGAIGEPQQLLADFGFSTTVRPEGRLFNPAFGGGALLDVGVYPVSLATMFFGPPTQVMGLGTLGETGIDEQNGMLLGHEGGKISVLSSAIRSRTPVEATLSGTEGWVRVSSPWYVPKRLVLARAGQEPETIETPFTGNGYNYEAAHVMACLREGKLESDIMPLSETLAIMRTLDELRRQWGLTYPMEA